MKLKLTDEQAKAFKDAGIEVPKKELDLQALAGVIKARPRTKRINRISGLSTAPVAKECNNLC